MARLSDYVNASVTDILYLHEDGEESAKMLRDLDVIRMPIYIQQVLETVWGDICKDHGTRMIARDPSCKWLKWVKESRENYKELWNYGMDIIDEHFFRFGSRNLHPYKHGSFIGFERLGKVPKAIPDVPMTPLPTSIEEARVIYKKIEGLHTNRGSPEWLRSN